jgi:putative two-component system response regulator
LGKDPAMKPSDKIINSKILIVDDNPTNVSLLEMMLDKIGYVNVFSTTDSREVEGLYNEHAFDLILLDIRMPHMDGFQVMERLLDGIENDYLPILVLTAQSELEVKHRALKMGAKDFITKPFEHIELMNRIANMLEVRSLYNDRRNQAVILEQKVEERTRQLSALQDATMIAMGSLAETRDNETGNHIRRTQRYVKALAEKLAENPIYAETLTPEYINLLYKSAPLHDIGKVGVPDRILLKPGKLTDEEFEEMKRHTTYGADAIRQAEETIDDPEARGFLSIGREIAHYHQEKWDGSGYPEALSGEDIPLPARLMAIADVYDALISRRVYKPPFPHDESIELIAKGKGTHFDPIMTDSFLEISEQFFEIAEQFSDSEEDLKEIKY